MNVEVSIIMGIYNCENTLAEAIDSIINQTYKNWELIMYDDGSVDNTYQIALDYANRYDNVFVYQNQKNLGLNKTLNNCLKYARGKYIARMDGDDISLPTRLEKEIQFLNSHLQYSIVSTPMIYFDENGDFAKGSMKSKPTINDVMKGTPFCHAPCMVKKEAFDKVGGYSEDKRTLRVEDYDLWVRMLSLGYKGYNLEEPLYKMRDDRNAYNRRKFKYRLNESYVKLKAFRLLKSSPYTLIYVLRPIIVGLLPMNIYNKLHNYNVNRRRK